MARLVVVSWLEIRIGAEPPGAFREGEGNGPRRAQDLERLMCRLLSFFSLPNKRHHFLIANLPRPESGAEVLVRGTVRISTLPRQVPVPFP
jgi:hypothetical protein